MVVRVLFACVLVAVMAMQSKADAPKVELVQRDGGWVLLRGGEPYFVRGVGGSSRLELAAKHGANSIRTWGQDELNPRQHDDGSFRSLLDYAHEHGMTVCAGFWVQKPVHGFDYSDPEAVRAQEEQAVAWVRKWKHHPAVLVWAIGNEVALQDPAESVFPFVNRIAKLVKEEDPSRPVMSVVAGAWDGKPSQFMQMCPDVDIMGINAYAGLPAVREKLDEAGYDGAYLIAEYGPRGHWEQPKTAWGAAIEQTSTQKGDHYAETYLKGIEQQRDLCIGGYAFVWGQKQERTETWYGMFTKNGEKTAPVDRVAEIWDVSDFGNRSPEIEPMVFGADVGSVEPGSSVEASVVSTDADGDRLSYRWVLKVESTDHQVGGAFEREPETIASSVDGVDKPGVTLRVPEEAGNYRLFVFVTDGRGAAATANVPFRVGSR